MKQLLLIFSIFITNSINSQSYAPAAGLPGSTAIHKDDTQFVAWATGVKVTRGYKNIANPSLGYTTVGNPEDVLGIPSGPLVSLGDRGEATVTFANPIFDGPGFDFAVFENGGVSFLELAIVEVSSDGVNFFGFPTHSETQTATQIGSFGSPAAEYLNNIAGKYAGNYGTPFDLNEIPNNPLLDKQNITHVKVIDVVGSIDPIYATFDSFNNPINDSYPTPFPSGGFDLQAVGVINEKVLSSETFTSEKFVLYPNPVKDVFYINFTENVLVEIYDITARLVKKTDSVESNGINVSDLPPGPYFVHFKYEEGKIVKKIIVQ
ncbi:T9SS type A sorting domain-containing protein [Flavobacterium ardleyense]|uniref:T9SS type A sorting domain-containing protein n=1 Tax=Flavobacterium ardleyense TaxID=2038737 RepID=A0ABW5ZAD8_9FLAO